jgi:hypothetical protein
VILFSFALLLGVAVGEFLVGAGVALGAGEVLVVEVVGRGAGGRLRCFTVTLFAAAAIGS